MNETTTDMLRDLAGEAYGGIKTRRRAIGEVDHGALPIALALSEAAIPALPAADFRLPEIVVALPEGGHATLPGVIWPELATRQSHDPGPGPAPVKISQIKRREANRLLVEWEHELGEYRRPFGEQHFTLDVAGEPLAVASSGSIVSATVAGRQRRVVVELARLGRHPEHPHVLRAMLRLWRLYLVDCWRREYWPVEMAAAYALPGKSGDLYRFDGWTRIGKCKPSGGGGTWSSSAPKANAIADGVKTLWVYDFRHSASTPTPSAPEQLPLALARTA